MELVQPIRDSSKIDEMVDDLRSHSLRDAALFLLGINSGLRVSDLIKLNCADVMETRTRTKMRIRLREKKTGKGKDFPLADAAKEAILEYLSTRKGWKMEEPLFMSRKDHGHLQRAQVLRILSGAAKRVGIADSIGTHSMRKTFGYMAHQSGYDITVIQKLLNHSSPAITLAYIGITQDQLDDVYTSLNLGGRR